MIHSATDCYQQSSLILTGCSLCTSVIVKVNLSNLCIGLDRA
jgi:hypothetical protein